MLTARLPVLVEYWTVAVTGLLITATDWVRGLAEY
jgi:hypothetical protein